MVVVTGHDSRQLEQASTSCFMAGNILCSKTLVLIGPRGVLCANERYLSICARLLFLHPPTTRMSVSLTNDYYAVKYTRIHAVVQWFSTRGLEPIRKLLRQLKILNNPGLNPEG